MNSRCRHGKGTDHMQKALQRDRLRVRRYIQKTRHARYEEGGAGVQLSSDASAGRRNSAGSRRSECPVRQVQAQRAAAVRSRAWPAAEEKSERTHRTTPQKIERRALLHFSTPSTENAICSPARMSKGRTRQSRSFPLFFHSSSKKRKEARAR